MKLSGCDDVRCWFFVCLGAFGWSIIPARCGLRRTIEWVNMIVNVVGMMIAGLQQEDCEKNALQQELDAIRERQRALPAVVESAQQTLDAEAQRLWKRKALVESKEETTKKRSDATAKMLKMYERRLSCTVSSDDGCVNVLLSNIDERQPERACKISVTMDDSGHYSCTYI